MKTKKIIVLKKPNDINKLANTMGCCPSGPSPVKPEE